MDDRIPFGVKSQTVFRKLEAEKQNSGSDAGKRRYSNMENTEGLTLNFHQDQRSFDQEKDMNRGYMQSFEANEKTVDRKTIIINDSSRSSDEVISYDNMAPELSSAQRNCTRAEQSQTSQGGLSGVGILLKKLRGEIRAPQKERIVLDDLGFRLRDRFKFPVCRVEEVQHIIASSCEYRGIAPPPVNTPTDVRVIRKMIRQKMIRCKVCKTRFTEKNIYERHLRDKHPVQYENYIIRQEEEAEARKRNELEFRRWEELHSGAFIPPETDVASEDPSGIPLPGEPQNGDFPDYSKIEKPHYVKKVSPQCPFCDKRYKDEISLKKHLNKMHEEASEFKQCLKCFKSVENDAEMELHDCELTYVCFQCTPIRNMCTEPRLTRHQAKFHRGANSGFRCKKCNICFLTPRKLRRHNKLSHVFENNVQCHFCDEFFISENHVMKHERIHTGIIKFECKVCDFTCNRFIELEVCF
uniref:C2H2-type domain-containing protein n=2 Tax=Caenorhabditis tropicalis TaxID=1561998 RepID=A0A1I7TCV2_9PELO